ncbi:hypothetical protein NLI96_g1266 [Meripilus lineatus]|uniref:MFS general substrate transporter n=1 Tax=Meripilus lineatus TaxID=2056292 RepID=A0AAD5VCV7_9APHY|nr:hypothetical protein NLI96_g1266 [Physisporinus lineatus]
MTPSFVGLGPRLQSVTTGGPWDSDYSRKFFFLPTTSIVFILEAAMDTIELAPRPPLPGPYPSYDSGAPLTSGHREIDPDQASQRHSTNEVSLHPVDTGFGAWSFLVGAFFIETLVWGFPNAFGVFLAAYLEDATLISQKHASSLLPLIGTLSSGLIYASGENVVHIAIVLKTHPEVTTLLALQGVLYGIGGSLIYAPCISYIAEWFVQRRGLATGVIFSGTATGGLLLPLILPQFITKFGAAKTLRYLAVAKLIMLTLTLPFIRPRLPVARVHGPSARSRGDRSWLKEKTLWLMIFANTLQGIAYFVPVVWLPSTLSPDFTISPIHRLTMLLLPRSCLLNGASLFGRVAIGILSDKVSPWFLAIGTLLCTSLATFVLWGVLSYSLAGIIAYGVVYGGVASSWSSLYTGFVRPIAKDDPSLATTLLGFFLLSRGLGNILSTPISTALRNIRSDGVATHPSLKSGFQVAGGQYEGMIVFVGTAFIGAAIIVSFAWGVDKWGARRRSPNTGHSQL